MNLNGLNIEVVEVTDYVDRGGKFPTGTPPRRWEIRGEFGAKLAIIFDSKLAEKLGAKPLVKASA